MTKVTKQRKKSERARKVPVFARVFAQDSRGEVDVVGKIINFKDPRKKNPKGRWKKIK
jgi:hypothetical protein